MDKGTHPDHPRGDPCLDQEQYRIQDLTTHSTTGQGPQIIGNDQPSKPILANLHCRAPGAMDRADAITRRTLGILGTLGGILHL